MFVTGLIAAFTIPSLGLAALFSAASRFSRNRDKAADLLNYPPVLISSSAPNGFLSQGDAAPAGTFEVIEARPEIPNDESTLLYKRKFRAILCNRSGENIEVRAPDWICSRGYVPFQSQPKPYFWSILEPEDLAAGGWKQQRWGKETNRLSVAPNQIFRATIGLDPSFSIGEINNRRATRTVGMLVVPMTIGTRDTEWRIQL
jgi:hypothetical protein